MQGKGFGRFLLGSILGGGIMVAGYAIFEFLMFNANQAIGSIPFNAIQWAGGVLVACALFPVVRSTKLISRLPS